eukprot:CAMPEP_0206435138 /NCGR_PEP_ID=MMETSP0324_2-20121206/9644_1 /ASSEMBLY_ACC=CAM_ASM_000836 /TAXON_ID=2866 /ORGANISM="Crypthecodinium cohnii, Strain Seligo" /LENGTH=138 /DNA_ID=CAMNT_0053901925 /DNA_START=139 /DNA_END=556 /DNA_ORIENTATION=-
MDEIDVDWGSEEPEEEADDDDDEFCNALGLEQVSLGLASTSVSSSQIASSRSSAPSPTPTPPGFLPHHAPAGRYKVILASSHCWDIAGGAHNATMHTPTKSKTLGKHIGAKLSKQAACLHQPLFTARVQDGSLGSQGF